MNVPLSGEEISNLLDRKVKVITYPELKRYRTLEELLYPYDSVVILYETIPDYGHWTCLFKYPKGNIVEFYDPYAGKPDSQLGYSIQTANDVNNEPLLVRLLYDYVVRKGGEIRYNDEPQQRLAKEIATCGRHCVVRLVMKNIPIDDYIWLFENVDADKIVTKLTS